MLSGVQTNNCHFQTLQPDAGRTQAEIKHAGRIVQAYEDGHYYIRAVHMGYWETNGSLTPIAPKYLKRIKQEGVGPNAKEALWSISHRISEVAYQNSDQKPRPVRHLRKGIHTQTTNGDAWHYDVYFGLLELDIMACWKADASTPFVKGDDYSAIYEYIFLNRKMLQSYEAFQEKRLEMERRRGSMYPWRSEGHFDEHGQHTGLHAKNPTLLTDFQKEISRSTKTSDYMGIQLLSGGELVTTGYRTKDYVSIIITPEDLFRPWQPPLWKELIARRSTPDSPVALVFYNGAKADIQVFYCRELPGLESGEYEDAVIELNKLCSLAGIPRNVFSRYFCYLGPVNAMKAAMACTEACRVMYKNLDNPEWRCFEALERIKQPLTELKALVHKVNHPNCQFFGSRASSFVELLFWRFGSANMQMHYGYMFEHTGEITIAGETDPVLTYENIAMLAANIPLLLEGWELSWEFLRQELDATTYTILPEQVVRNPLIATELYMAGATIAEPGQYLLPLMTVLIITHRDTVIHDIHTKLIAFLHDSQRGEEFSKAIQAFKLLQSWEESNRDETTSTDTFENHLGDVISLCSASISLLQGCSRYPEASASLFRPLKPRNRKNAQVIRPPVEDMLASVIDLHEKLIPLNLDSVWSFPENAQKIIEKYYLVPSKTQIYEGLKMGGYSPLYRNIHGADHICRTAKNVEWLTELFQKHQLDNGWLTPKALTLLQYAALYHDITAEIDAKHLEELNAAAAMERDLTEQITKEDQELFQDVISALRNKNVNDMTKDKIAPPFSPDQEGIRERLFRRILRMADSFETTRCFTVDDDFAELPKGRHRFNIHYSDVPKVSFYKSPKFQQELIAGVENMMDLGFMTGGPCPEDLRRKGNYGTRFCLRDSPADHRKRQIVISHAPDVYQRIQREQELLIGRRIVAELGYHPYIRLGTDTSVDMPMIWHDDDLETFMDLIQPVISGLTPLQKVTFTQPGLLNELVKQARLLIPGNFQITRPLGTLSQLDLQCSPALREVLKARNLKVIRKTYPMNDWTGEKASYLRVVDINDTENEEEPLKSAELAQEKRKERRVRMRELRNTLRILWNTTNRLT